MSQKDAASRDEQQEKRVLGVSKNVFFLGLTSLFNDISSEMIYPLIPIFLTTVLGTPVAFVGLIEGIAESTASLMKLVSGRLSDRFNQRKLPAVIGYALGAVGKPLLAVSFVWWQALFARFTDRLGKGIRTAPRDALIADSSSPDAYGRSFGFHRTMDTVGAAIGPLMALFLFPALNQNFRTYFAIAIIPAIISIFVLVKYVTEPRRSDVSKKIVLERFSLAPFNRSFKIFLLIALVFTLGNSSDAFLVLRAQNVGISVALIPLVYLIFNLVSASIATPAGIISDKIGRKRVIAVGFATFSAVYLGFALAKTTTAVWLLFAAYGLYAGFTESIFKAYAADLAPANLRGTAYGLLNLVLGIALLPASFVAGLLWQYVNPAATFYYGSAMSLFALILFVLFSLMSNRARV
ncbi:MAG TPA: MFS transporter [Candidatus Aquicultor sp.]